LKKTKELIIFFGPPGSGKGSLAQLCIQDLGWQQLSTGNLCRKHIAQNTEIGKEIDFTIKSGKLVPDSLIIQMVESWFNDHGNNQCPVILDGYPRTRIQAQALSGLLEQKLPFVTLRVINFLISDERVIERLNKRYICKNEICQAIYSIKGDGELAPKFNLTCNKCNVGLIRRKDDEPEAVRERLVGYYEHAHHLIMYYKEIAQPIIEISVDKPLKVVFDEFVYLLGQSNK
jgi:adenylate kinase